MNAPALSRSAKRVLLIVASAEAPMSASEVAKALGGGKWKSVEHARSLLNSLTAAGVLVKEGDYKKTFRIAAPAETVERFAVDVPEHGHAGITDPDVLDEIEAEKVWTVAALLRGGNTAWGIDMGLDADVREARALMAEARRQVRERSPLGNHYFEGEPGSSAPAEEEPSP